MPEDIIVIKSFFLSIFFSKYFIKISKYSYFYKDLFTLAIVENYIFIFLFQITDSDEYFGWLFRMPVAYYFSGLLFQLLFQMTISDDYFGSGKMIDLQTRMKHIRT